MINKNVSTPLYKQLKEHIIKFIKEKDIQIDEKLPTESQFMKKFNASHFTVRQTFDELQREGVIYRVRPKGTFLKTNPDNLLMTQTNNNLTIGILTDIQANEFFVLIARAIEQEALKNNCNVLVCEGYSQLKFDPFKYSQALKEKKLQGVIIAPPYERIEEEIYHNLLKEKIPFVIVDKFLKGINVDHVTVDNFNGNYNATKHLIELGHKKIGYIAATDTSVGVDRLEGYKKAMEDSGIGFDPSLVEDGWWTLERGYVSTLKLLNRIKGITAIITVCDSAAIGAYRACRELGKTIPKDISIMGFDDLPISRMWEVPLTTIVQPIEEMGRVAVELLFNKISNYGANIKHIKIKPEIVIRKSTMELKQGRTQLINGRKQAAFKRS